MSVQEAEPVQQTSLSDSLPNAPGAAENVEQIREILFGPLLRDYAQRFARIEERLAQESADLRAEMRRRLDLVESYARQEVDHLGERLRTECGERNDSCNRLSQALADAVQSLERRLAESEERTAGALREFRESTYHRIEGVLDDLTQQMGSMDSSQNRRLEELRTRSIERSALAGLLSELALRVRGNPE